MTTADVNQAGRLSPALYVIGYAVMLALLWLLRPPLPQLEPGRGVSSTGVEELTQLVVWTLLTLMTLRRALHALHAFGRQPSRRGLAERERLLRLLTPPTPPREPPATRKRYRPPRKLSRRRSPANASEGAPVTATSITGNPPPAASSNQIPEPAIRVSLLGPFKIEGTEHEKPRGTCQQLIAYLVLHPRGATRDQLIEAIWPEEDLHKARHRFWQNVSEARRLLGDALISKHSHYTLDRHRVAVDADEVERLLAEANASDQPKRQRPTLERALRLFRGQPLAGWDHPWAEEDARRLRSTHIDLLERVGHTRIVTGDPHGALQAAQDGLALDSYNEGLWRLAMRAEGSLGNRDSLSQRYQQLRDLLQEQLGLEPERATRALYHELLGQR
jgi:DNA-binding SARP family transcriptional activator